MTDNEIIELFFERSEDAISQFAIKYGSTIKAVASNILKNSRDAEECVNDTYLQLWNSIPPEQPRYLAAYSCRIARNICLNRYHSNAAKKRNSHYDTALEELENTIPAFSTVETEYDARELASRLNSFLASLPPEDRFIFMRRYWHGSAVSQIASAAGTSAHYISVRLFRLRKQLQKHLRKEGFIS